MEEQEQDQTREGVITAHHGVGVMVRFCATGETELVRVKRNSGHVVGDRVQVTGEMLERLERSSELFRADTRGGRHTVAANLDVVCIVVSCEPLPPPGFIDRAAVASRSLGLRPILVVNKTDLPPHEEFSRQLHSTYQDSLLILETSAESGSGLAQLTGYFAEGHRGVFVGPSGVGKSSLLNAMLPEINLQTGEISETKKRGRNTTTVATLHHLPAGGELIDSPGFNDFGLVDISAAELACHFPGFEATTAEPCKFRDCRHREEPECTITRLVAEQEIGTDRFTTYHLILQEVEATENQPKYRQLRHRRKKNG